MKVLFLDIDGVLNGMAFLGDQDRDALGGLEPWENHIDPRCVRKLNRVLRLSGAKVVLSSSWRYAFRDVPDCQQFLEQVGFRGEVLDFTPRGTEGSGRREEEILQWVRDRGEEYGVTRWVAVDDSALEDCLPKGAFVRTDILIGMTAHDARLLLAALLP